MPDIDRRRKMISLRLSEVEYEALKTKYRIHGARNISDFARLALQRIVSEPANSLDSLASRLSHLDERVDALESQLASAAKR